MPSDDTVRFVKSMFSKHYREAALRMPDRFSKREFGFMFFDRQGMVRHTGFPTRASLKKYLAEQVPAHAYYSCAYYEKPDAPTMLEKRWQGADLIFDLDADHVEGAQNLPFDKMLERVKTEVIRLIDDFLLGDFGFEPGELKIVFSGGRGYHVHISDPKVLKLSSHERREIVDYITGTDLDMDWVFPPTPFQIGRFREIPLSERKRGMPSKTEGGWRARIRMGIDGVLEELEELQEKEAVEYLKGTVAESKKEMGEKTLVGLYRDLFAGKAGTRGADRMRSENTFEVFSAKRHADAFVELVELRVKSRMKGETDEPVTSDIKRLIRLPSSLHGKTGFEVVPLKRDELDGFNPFSDAVPKAFGKREVGVRLEKPVEVRLRDRQFSLDAGLSNVPEFVAVFLACRRLATVESH
ncbi:MAG: DNA primase catalytic subunit PriS [Candidatus Thermoplasmatota archaeon]|nr:DNA primase catalytic subunit PriS [Candidatus Thermoplasmatota archaeon]